MAQHSPRIPGAGRASTASSRGRGSSSWRAFLMTRSPLRRKDLSGPRRPRRQDAVEEIDTAGHGVQEILGITHSHEVARPPGRQHRRRHRNALVKSFGRLPYRQTADGEAVEGRGRQFLARATPQFGVERPLLDGEDASAPPPVFGPDLGGPCKTPARPLGTQHGRALRTAAARRDREDTRRAPWRHRRRSPDWVSMTFSGVKRCSLPSMCERKVTPSSSSRRRAASEKTWNPPESVRIGPSQPITRCRPPRRTIRSSPGRRSRW